MKKMSLFLVVALLAVAAAFAQQSPLVGTWIRTEGSGDSAKTAIYVFNADGTGVYTYIEASRRGPRTYDDPFKWSVSGNRLTTTFDSGAQIPPTYSINGNTATIGGQTFTLQPLVGTWGRSAGSKTDTYVFNGDGTGVFTERSGNTVVDTDPFTWTVSGDTLTTTYTDGNRVVSNRYSISGDTLALGSVRYTRQAAAAAAPPAAASPLVGTWGRSAGGKTVTYVFNGDGTGVFTERSGSTVVDTDPFKWTISGDTLTTTYTDGNRVVPNRYSISGDTLALGSVRYTRQ